MAALTMSLDTARRVFLGALVVLVAGYGFVPDVRPVAVAGVGILSAAGVILGAVRQRSPRLGAWLMLALAVLVLTAGEVLHHLAPAPAGYPSAADVLFLVSCLPLAVGLLWLGRSPVASRDWPTILDTVALSLAGALLVWIVLVRPAIVSPHLTGPGMVTAIGVGFVAVLAACARVVLAWRTNTALAILSAGVVSFLISGFLYGVVLVNGTGREAGPVYLGFPAFCALCGAAALTPSMVKVASAPYERHQLGPWRLAMLAVALLVAPSALLVQATAGPVTTGVAIAVVSTAVGLLMLVRLAIAYRRRAAREQAIRAASRALVLATTSDEVEAGLTVALAGMLPNGVPSAAHLVDQGRRGSRVIPETGPDSATVSTTELSPGSADSAIVDGRPGGLRVAVDPDPGAGSGGYRVIEYVAPTAHLVELAQVLQALAYQAGSALARIDLVARLRAHERERYFGTLVRTSTDVILISRHGRIDYATPSADAMFGRDVRGEAFDDVVERAAKQRGSRSWAAAEEDTEGYVRRRDASALTVLVHRRDLTADPTVNGVVTTLRDVTAERDLQRNLAYRASHDSLTGLANAELLRDELRSDRTCATGTGLSVVLFIDLDNFKNVNDSFGHEVGDGLLVTVARRIQSCLRSEDLAARLGGDEFAVLLRDVPGSAAARAAAQRIADALARPADVAGIGVDCQASIGLALASTPAEFDSLMRRADTALYTAKAAGKGRWRQYQDDMISPVRRRADLRDELETAIRDDKLTLHYQPIVELSTGRVEGFEALIRFHGESAPAMRPEQLVGIAEDNALIVFLGDWVLRRALADAARFNPPDGGPPRYVSVNVSARQLRQPGFAETVRAHLAAAGVAGSLLVLEITESLLLTEDERAWNRLAKLRRYGVRVAIDDYGTGYASLSYLRQPAIDIVKIDRSFLQDLTSQRARALLDAVIRLASRLGLDQIAEGVEDPHAVEVLRSLGCRHGQGFLYSPAMPAAQADQWAPVPTGYGANGD